MVEFYTKRKDDMTLDTGLKGTPSGKASVALVGAAIGSVLSLFFFNLAVNESSRQVNAIINDKNGWFATFFKKEQ